MLADDGATPTFVDPLLNPRLQDIQCDYCVLDVPHTIVAAGEHVLQGVATGAVQGTGIDDVWRERQFSFEAFVVPRMGANLFSVTEAMWKGGSTIFHPHKPRMEFDDIVLVMNLLGTDERQVNCCAPSWWSLEVAPVDFLCELNLRTCGTGAWDTSTARAWMSCGEYRAV